MTETPPENPTPKPIEVTNWDQIANNTEPLPEGTEVVYRGEVLDDLLDDIFGDG